MKHGGFRATLSLCIRKEYQWYLANNVKILLKCKCFSWQYSQKPIHKHNLLYWMRSSICLHIDGNGYKLNIGLCRFLSLHRFGKRTSNIKNMLNDDCEWIHLWIQNAKQLYGRLHCFQAETKRFSTTETQSVSNTTATNQRKIRSIIGRCLRQITAFMVYHHLFSLDKFSIH